MCIIVLFQSRSRNLKFQFDIPNSESQDLELQIIPIDHNGH